MSLERRIADALQAAGAYQPSVDLFARLQRSIEEDRAHRRRVRAVAAALVSASAILVIFILTVAERQPDGVYTVPNWSMQVAVTAILVVVLMGLGPVFRRVGRPLIEELFHLDTTMGDRFSELLDIAYYLFFSGVIVIGIDPTHLGRHVSAADGEVTDALGRIALFILALGVAHVVNLAVLPVIGLIFSSLVRRRLRRTAAADAPLESPGARRAERVVMGLLLALALLVVAGTLTLVAAMIGLGLTG